MRIGCPLCRTRPTVIGSGWQVSLLSSDSLVRHDGVEPPEYKYAGFTVPPATPTD